MIMNTDEILDMIDHAVSGHEVSPDAMRWSPGPPPQKKLQLGYMPTIDQVRVALQGRLERHAAIIQQLEQQTGDGWYWGNDTVYRLGPGTITTVDEHTGQVVQTPFVSGSVTPLP